MGIGPMTSSLPKKCSTTELRGHSSRVNLGNISPLLRQCHFPRYFDLGDQNPSIKVLWFPPLNKRFLARLSSPLTKKKHTQFTGNYDQ